MSFNPLSLLFAPGLAIAGYVLGAAPGSAAALLSWGVLVGSASAWVALRVGCGQAPSPCGAERHPRLHTLL